MLLRGADGFTIPPPVAFSGLSSNRGIGQHKARAMVSRNPNVKGPGLFARPLSAESSGGGGGSNKGGPSIPGGANSKWKEVLKEFAIPIAIGVAVLAFAGSQAGSIQSNIAGVIESAVTKISGMGTMGYLYFAAVRLEFIS